MIYNVVLQSAIGAGGAVSEQFYYDWSQLEDVPYKVSFSFMCPVVNLTNTAIATIYADLGQSQNQIAQSQNTSSTIYKGSYLGSLFYTPYGANGYLYADIATNPITYLAGRPRNNNFLVEIHNNTAGNVDYAPAPAQYTLILNFEKIQK